MTADEFCARFPSVFHAAAAGSWDSLRHLGLLPVSKLLDMAGVAPNDRYPIERNRRSSWVTIRVEGHEVRLRDQKPLIVSKLATALIDTTVEEWFRLLNERVFLWSRFEELERFLTTRSYKEDPHLVLEIDSRELIHRHGGEVVVALMNTGATRPFAHPRGKSTFRRLADVDRGQAARIREVTVVGGVPDLIPVVRQAYLFRNGAKAEQVWQSRSDANEEG